MRRNCSKGSGSMAWVIFSGLLALGITAFLAREMPAIRREYLLMKM